jgi:hypothetical protein
MKIAMSVDKETAADTQSSSVTAAGPCSNRGVEVRIGYGGEKPNEDFEILGGYLIEWIPSWYSSAETRQDEGRCL